MDLNYSGEGCKFFEWLDDAATGTSTSAARSGSGGYGASSYGGRAGSSAAAGGRGGSSRGTGTTFNGGRGASVGRTDVTCSKCRQVGHYARECGK